MLLVTGTVNQRNKHVLKNIYDQMPGPKAVIAIGACGCTGGVFREAYNVVGGVDKVIPVDATSRAARPAPKPSSTASWPPWKRSRPCSA